MLILRNKGFSKAGEAVKALREQKKLLKDREILKLADNWEEKAKNIFNVTAGKTRAERLRTGRELVKTPEESKDINHHINKKARIKNGLAEGYLNNQYAWNGSMMNDAIIKHGIHNGYKFKKPRVVL